MVRSPPLSSELLELAIELEALAEGTVDRSADDQVLRVIERSDVGVVLAGVVLAHLLRIGDVRARSLIERVSPAKRGDLVQAMLVAQPQAAVRMVGAQQLRNLLAESQDRYFHDQVASAFEGQVVADSEICLPALLPDARRRLAQFLAERAGRDDGIGRDWMKGDFGAHCLPAFCFGLLCGRFSRRFNEVSTELDRAGWRALQQRVQGRSFELTPQGAEIYLAVRDASGHVPNEVGLKLSRRPAANVGQSNKAGRGVALCGKAKDAGTDEIPALLVEAHELDSPTWRREAQLALLRRALTLGTRISPFAFGLRRADVAAEIAASRITAGELALMAGRSWNRIDVDRRFAILSQVITSAADGASAESILDAVLAMPGAVRGILIERLLAVLGQSPSMTDEQLSRISEDDVVQDDVLVVLARTLALRGATRAAKETMQRAEALVGHRRSQETMLRLGEILQDPGGVPYEVAPAVASRLAALGGAELTSALALCRSRLAEDDYQRVVADVIVRGRAMEAFAEVL